MMGGEVCQDLQTQHEDQEPVLAFLKPDLSSAPAERAQRQAQSERTQTTASWAGNEHLPERQTTRGHLRVMESGGRLGKPHW